MKKIFKKIIKYTLLIFVIQNILYWSIYHYILHYYPFPYSKFENIEYSKYIYNADGKLIILGLNKKDSWILPVKLYEINPLLINATIAIEDKNYYRHNGVDSKAIIRAIYQNISNKKIVSGASTISMQVVGLIEPLKRTIPDKIIQMVHAVKLEKMYSKKEILKLYFEIAPYGGNIYGVKAASLRYFRKIPNKLDLPESALLAGLPQSPTRFRPDRYPHKAKIRRNMVFLRMLNDKYISIKDYKQFIDTPITAGCFSLSTTIPK